MSTALTSKRKSPRLLRPIEAEFIAFYLGRKGNTLGNASLALRQAHLAFGDQDGASRVTSTSAWKMLHRPRVAKIITRALASRTVGDEEVMGRLSDVLMTPRSEWEKGVMDAGHVIKAAEVLGRFKRMGADPFERLITRHIKQMAAAELPPGMAGLLGEGEEVLEVSPVPPPLRTRSPMQAPRPRQKKRSPPRRHQVIEVEAHQVDDPPGEAMPGHDAVQHDDVTQCVIEAEGQHLRQADQVEASTSPRCAPPPHRRPSTR